MELRQGMSDEFLACQQPFNNLPKFPTDAEQDLRPNFNFAGCHRGSSPWVNISVMDSEDKRQGLEQVRARIEDGIPATLAGFPAITVPARVFHADGERADRGAGRDRIPRSAV
jgi:hypothetical protein